MAHDGEITRTIDLPAPPEVAFNELTGAGMGEWMGGDVRIDPRPGGTIEFDDPRGVTRWGIIEEWSAPDHIRFRWHDRDGDRSATTVEFRLEPLPSGTRLTVTETFPGEWPQIWAQATFSRAPHQLRAEARAAA